MRPAADEGNAAGRMPEKTVDVLVRGHFGVADGSSDMGVAPRLHGVFTHADWYDVLLARGARDVRRGARQAHTCGGRYAGPTRPTPPFGVASEASLTPPAHPAPKGVA